MAKGRIRGGEAAWRQAARFGTEPNKRKHTGKLSVGLKGKDGHGEGLKNEKVAIVLLCTCERRLRNSTWKHVLETYLSRGLGRKEQQSTKE